MFSADNNFIALAQGEGSAIARRVFVFARGGAAPIFQQDFQQMVTAIAFAPRAPILAVATEGSAIHLFPSLESKANASPRLLLGHEERVGDLSFLPDGETLASVSNDGTLRTWRTRAPEARAPLSAVLTNYPWLHPAASRDGERRPLR